MFLGVLCPSVTYTFEKGSVQGNGGLPNACVFKPTSAPETLTGTLGPWKVNLQEKLIFYFGETFIILCMIRSRLVGLTPFSIFSSGHVTALDARKNHLFGRQGCRSDAPLHAGIPPPSPSRWSPQYLACVLCICLVSYLVFYLVSCLLSCCCCMVLS